MHDVCEDNELSDTFGITSNTRPKGHAGKLLQRAIDSYNASRTKPRLSTPFEYPASFRSHT